MKPERNASSDGGTKSCLLDEMAPLAQIPQDIRRDLSEICVRKVYRAGQIVIEIGAATATVGIVREGILRMQKTNEDGREHIVGLLVQGDIFGSVFNGPMHFSVEAATDAEVYAFRREPFEALLMRSPELERVFLLNMMNELDRSRDWMIILASPKARSRLAGFLLLMCTRFREVDHLVALRGGSVRVHVPISLPDLANLLGMRVGFVSRALHALAEDGLIEILRPDLIAIRRIEQLAEESADCEVVDPASVQRLVKDLRRSAN